MPYSDEPANKHSLYSDTRDILLMHLSMHYCVTTECTVAIDKTCL